MHILFHRKSIDDGKDRNHVLQQVEAAWGALNDSEQKKLNCLVKYHQRKVKRCASEGKKSHRRKLFNGGHVTSIPLAYTSARFNQSSSALVHDESSCSAISRSSPASSDADSRINNIMYSPSSSGSCMCFLFSVFLAREPFSDANHLSQSTTIIVTCKLTSLNKLFFCILTCTV